MIAAEIILHDQRAERLSYGRYAYGAYSVPGRLYYGLKTSIRFLLVSLVLLCIPGESFFYGVFFFIFVTYYAYVLSRLKTISFHVDGACPSCGEMLRFRLEPDEHLPIWKYCPYCDASFRISEPPEPAPIQG